MVWILASDGFGFYGNGGNNDGIDFGTDPTTQHSPDDDDEVFEKGPTIQCPPTPKLNGSAQDEAAAEGSKGLAASVLDFALGFSPSLMKLARKISPGRGDEAAEEGAPPQSSSAGLLEVAPERRKVVPLVSDLSNYDDVIESDEGITLSCLLLSTPPSNLSDKNHSTKKLMASGFHFQGICSTLIHHKIL